MGLKQMLHLRCKCMTSYDLISLSLYMSNTRFNKPFSVHVQHKYTHVRAQGEVDMGADSELIDVVMCTWNSHRPWFHKCLFSIKREIPVHQFILVDRYSCMHAFIIVL